MQSAATRLRLPLRHHVWRGLAGNWQGAGLGNSIDFQDHRPYLPGDDPRYIDWSAYARTGHYAMKLYREEVGPQVDLVWDTSASMFGPATKAQRTWELLYWVAESAWQSGATLRCYALSATKVISVNPELLRRYRLETLVEDTPPAFGGSLERLPSVPWRQGSLRVVVSDLLFPSSAEAAIKILAMNKGRGAIYAPFTREESDPEWQGNLLLVDRETKIERKQRVEADGLQRYRKSYERHFALWKQSARRHGTVLARVPAELTFIEALQAEALHVGAVEMVD
jgi:uncharacterized protein (DUF58 family)